MSEENINLTAPIHAATKQGKAVSAREVFMDGDKETVQQIGEKTHQLEDAIKDITATGGASTANAVSYSNSTSGMTAVTAQGAIDELASKKANSADVISQMQTEQTRVNAELEKKFNLTNITQESGDAEDKVMSQKAVSTKLSNLSEKLSDVEKKTDTIEEECITIEDTEGNEIVSVTKKGVSANNITSGGKKVLTEHQDISNKADKDYVDYKNSLKQDKLNDVTSVFSSESEEEIIFESEQGEKYASVGSYGIKAKNIYDLLGNPLLVKIDKTLSKENESAEAKAVGEKFSKLNTEIVSLIGKEINKIKVSDTKTKWDIVFAAEDSNASDQAMADFICHSDDAQEVIQNAIDDWFSNKSNSNCGNFLFCDGTYYITHFNEPIGNDSNGTFYALRMPKGSKSTDNATKCKFAGVHNYGTGYAKFVVKKDVYVKKADGSQTPLETFINSLTYQEEDSFGPARYLNDHKRYSVFRCETSGNQNFGYSNWCSYVMEFDSLRIEVGEDGDNALKQYPIIAIDAIYSSCLTLKNCQIYGKENLPVYTIEPAINVGYSGVRCPRGQSHGFMNVMQSNYISAFYTGIELGSEHWSINDTAVRFCTIGISRGSYHDWLKEGSNQVAGSMHCISLVNCAIERCYWLMVFFNNGSGWTEGGCWDVRALSIEWTLGIVGEKKVSRGCFIETRNGNTNPPKGFFQIQNKPYVMKSDGYEIEGVDRCLFTKRLTSCFVDVIDFPKIYTDVTNHKYQILNRKGEHGMKVYDAVTHQWYIWNCYTEDFDNHKDSVFKYGDDVSKNCYYGRWETLQGESLI